MVKYIDFDIFRPYTEIAAAFSTKEGGVSKGIYESMNLSLSTDDDPANVQENYRRFAESIGVSKDLFVLSVQQHTTNIRILRNKEESTGIDLSRAYDSVDGFITAEKGLVLCLRYADCVPVYFYDPVQKVIALVHSGWKGTVGKISAKAVSLMGTQYGSRPEDILTAIGPSICDGCYEVSEDLLFAFDESFDGSNNREKSPEGCMQGVAGDFFRYGRVTGEGEQKYQLSLWRAIEYTLRQTGITEDHIDNPRICTCCNHDLFFSHRYTNGRRGNLAAAIALKE